ncbi:hypothetical protein [Bacillus thuringiensis]|uniref:hypothetical protein n=1 Tax=Bacillus thuringiensis TaxID=1428 RepID=UPI000539393F|nr:hypothetical protein [Bacillus thuringiensis]MDA2359154.1 hypothetical protein [Bacillus cereus]
MSNLSVTTTVSEDNLISSINQDTDHIYGLKLRELILTERMIAMANNNYRRRCRGLGCVLFVVKER